MKKKEITTEIADITTDPIKTWITNQIYLFKQTNSRTFMHDKLSIDELKKLTGSENNYPNTSQYITKVVEKSIKEFNEESDFNIAIERVKKKRVIQAVRFNISKKTKQQLKDRDNLLELLHAPSDADKICYADAMANPYTLLLVNLGVLFSNEFIHQPLMTMLQREVYPKFEKFKNKFGEDELFQLIKNQHMRKTIPNHMDIDYWIKFCDSIKKDIFKKNPRKIRTKSDTSMNFLQELEEIIRKENTLEKLTTQDVKRKAELMRYLS